VRLVNVLKHFSVFSTLVTLKSLKPLHDSHKQARKQRGTGTHEKQKETNEHDRKETAVFLETGINT
jgi:hypothetical protein